MIKNTVRINAQGFNHARLLDALSAAQINVYNFTRGEKSREFAFCVQKKDLRKTFAILDEMCYNYTVAGFSRYKGFGVGLLRRLGLIAGALAFSAVIAFSRGFVWRINIEGNESVPDKVIENTLAAHNIKVGSRLSRFDSRALETALREIDGIKLASVRLSGTTVRVEVFESDQIAPPLNYSDVDILSEYDATVTRIITREGTALVEVGQHVFKGAPLIGAHRVDEEGNKIPSRASGKVYGAVAFTKSVTVATEWYERVPVWVKNYTVLGFFGLNIGKKPPNGAGYEIEETTQKLNVFLPVKVKSYKVTKTEMRKFTATVDELAQKTEDKIVTEFIDSRVTSGLKVSRTVRELGGGVYRVNVFIEAETLIGGI